MTAVAMPRIRFDAEGHTYTLDDGTRLPSVTEILRAVGVSVDFEVLAARSPALADALALKRAIGTALHADTVAYDAGDLNWTTVDPRVEPYVRAWAAFRETTGLVPLVREHVVHHGGLGYAGTLDGIFRRAEGGTFLLDIKSGDLADSGCRYQTAAYQAAYAWCGGELYISERWGVQLCPDRAIPYEIEPYTDWRDMASFQSFLTTYHCQVARRSR